MLALFPDLPTIVNGSALSAPSAKSLESYIDHAYTSGGIKEEMEGAMMRTEPGEFMSIDATFKLARVTTSKARMLHFVLGERSNVCGWYATETDTWDDLETGLHCCSERFKELDVEGDLKYVYTDTCCAKCSNTPEDLANHCTVRHFDGVTRRPFGDAFHYVQTLTRACGKMEQKGDYTIYCQEVGKLISQPNEGDIRKVAVALQLRDRRARKDKRWSIEHWIGVVRECSTYNYVIRSEKRSGVEIAAALRALKQKWSQVKGWARKEIPGIKMSTDRVFENIIECALKGCMSDPMPTEDMYTLVGHSKELELPIYAYKGGSGKNETLHSTLNRLLANYSVIGHKKMQRLITMILYAHNQKCDVKHSLCDEGPVFGFRMIELNELAEGALASKPFAVIGATKQTTNSDDCVRDRWGFDYCDDTRTKKRVGLMLEVASTGASYADGGSRALAVGGAPAAKRQKSVRVAAKVLMPLAMDQAVKPTTLHEHALIQISMQQVMHEKSSMKGAGPISLATEKQYMVNLMINATLDIMDTSHRWGPTLYGKLDLRGRIEKETIVALYDATSTNMSRANMSLNSFGTSTLGASQPVVLHLGVPAVISPMGGGAIGTSPMATDTAAATTIMALTNGGEPDADAARGGDAGATSAKPRAGRKDTHDANELVARGVALVRRGHNAYQVYTSHTTLGAGGAFTTPHVKILSAYVKAMQERSVKLRRAGKVAPDAPKIVCGGKAKNDKKAAHLLSQMELFFTHYASEKEKEEGSFVP